MPAAMPSNPHQGADPASQTGQRSRTATLLRESEARFRTILECAAIGISVNTYEGTPILSNPAMQKMLAYTGDELAELNYLHFTHPDDRAWETQLMADLAAGRIEKYQLEKRYICKGGRVMWGRLTVSLLDQGGAEPHHFVAMVEDITDRKRAEDASREREAELAVIAELSQAMREATTFAEVVESLVERVTTALAARACGILLLEGSTLNLVASRGLTDPPARLELAEQAGVVGQAVHTGEIVCLACATATRAGAADCVEASDQDRLCTLDPQAALVVLTPLRSSDVTLGLVYLAFARDDALAPGVRKLLHAVADIGSNAIQRARVLQTLEQQVSDRTRRLKTLYEVSAAASQPTDLGTILRNALQTLVAALPGCAGAIILLEDKTRCRPPLLHSNVPDAILAALGQGFAVEAPWTRVLIDGLSLRLSKGAPDRRLPAWLRTAGCQAYLGLPVRANGEAVGVLSLFWHTEPRLTIDDLALTSAIAAEMGRSVERAELRRQAEQALIAEERQRLARDLHDSITQLLCGQALLAEASRNFVAGGDAQQAEPYLNELVDTAHQALKEMRLMIYDLRPSVLAAEGLVGAISWRLEAVEQRAGIKTQLVGKLTTPLARHQEEGLYRIVQELLNNVLRHAAATSVTVRLGETAEYVEVEVIDDGKGFTPDASRQGIGLKSIHERIELLGGALDVTSGNGQGCRVLVRLRPAGGDF